MIITVKCKDRIGLVAAISNVIAQQNISILSLREFVDLNAGLFFARVQVEPQASAELLRAELQAALPEAAVINLNKELQKDIVVLVTKEHHCLADLLVRHHYQTLGANVKAVIGNHSELAEVCKRFEVPFFFISNEGKSLQEYEAELLEAVNKINPQFLVLAKFMRILSPKFIEQFQDKIINIHHSFLPAFVGSKPYLRAYQRGVKLIGATAHFVTAELDAGPIIAQQTISVNHADSVRDMIMAGREIEVAVLAKALKLVFEDRVFVHNNKTVVFE